MSSSRVVRSLAWLIAVVVLLVPAGVAFSAGDGPASKVPSKCRRYVVRPARKLEFTRRCTIVRNRRVVRTKTHTLHATGTKTVSGATSTVTVPLTTSTVSGTNMTVTTSSGTTTSTTTITVPTLTTTTTTTHTVTVYTSTTTIVTTILPTLSAR
jgi:hypothetical protein